MLNCSSRAVISCSESPSRLKGIETHLLYRDQLVRDCWKCSESPSRLKGIETQSWTGSEGYLNPSSESPSRLKGIETEFHHPELTLLSEFGKSFPFEGN